MRLKCKWCKLEISEEEHKKRFEHEPIWYETINPFPDSIGQTMSQYEGGPHIPDSKYDEFNDY